MILALVEQSEAHREALAGVAKALGHRGRGILLLYILRNYKEGREDCCWIADTRCGARAIEECHVLGSAEPGDVLGALAAGLEGLRQRGLHRGSEEWLHVIIDDLSQLDINDKSKQLWKQLKGFNAGTHHTWLCLAGADAQLQTIGALKRHGVDVQTVDLKGLEAGGSGPGSVAWALADRVLSQECDEQSSCATDPVGGFSVAAEGQHLLAAAAPQEHALPNSAGECPDGQVAQGSEHLQQQQEEEGPLEPKRAGRRRKRRLGSLDKSSSKRRKAKRAEKDSQPATVEQALPSALPVEPLAAVLSLLGYPPAAASGEQQGQEQEQGGSGCKQAEKRSRSQSGGLERGGAEQAERESQDEKVAPLCTDAAGTAGQMAVDAPAALGPAAAGGGVAAEAEAAAPSMAAGGQLGQQASLPQEEGEAPYQPLHTAGVAAAVGAAAPSSATQLQAVLSAQPGSVELEVGEVGKALLPTQQPPQTPARPILARQHVEATPNAGRAPIIWQPLQLQQEQALTPHVLTHSNGQRRPGPYTPSTQWGPGPRTPAVQRPVAEAASGAAAVVAAALGLAWPASPAAIGVSRRELGQQPKLLSPVAGSGVAKRGKCALFQPQPPQASGQPRAGGTAPLTAGAATPAAAAPLIAAAVPGVTASPLGVPAPATTAGATMAGTDGSVAKELPRQQWPQQRTPSQLPAGRAPYTVAGIPVGRSPSVQRATPGQAPKFARG